MINRTIAVGFVILISWMIVGMLLGKKLSDVVTEEFFIRSCKIECKINKDNLERILPNCRQYCKETK